VVNAIFVDVGQIASPTVTTVTLTYQGGIADLGGS
jgi:hypothetical protein